MEDITPLHFEKEFSLSGVKQIKRNHQGKEKYYIGIFKKKKIRHTTFYQNCFQITWQLSEQN